MTNRYEQANRQRKVKVLAGHLQAFDVTRDEARSYDTERIAEVAAQAGVHAPSAATWQLVVDALPVRYKNHQGSLFERPKPRRPWAAMDQIVQRFDRQMMAVGLLRGIHYHWGGSYRRQASTCGDLDLIVVTDGHLREVPLPSPLECRADLVQYSRDVDLPDGTAVQVDVWRCQPNQTGPFLAFVTGPKEWNIHCRTLALRKGWMLSQFALTDEVGRRIDTNDEGAIFEALGLPPLTPTERQQWRTHLQRRREFVVLRGQA